MAGKGLNMAVIVSRKSFPSRVLMARKVRTAAMKTPVANPIRSTLIESSARVRITPEAMPCTSARTVALKVGTSSSLSSHRA
jgi:hypothetical protein